ncbi:unnamed protein product [Ectocarpus sp. 8 AP-2014]
MAGPDAGIKPAAFDRSTREVVFFNPSIMSRTPGLTPFPDSGGTRPWVVTPHPRVVVKDKLGAPEPAPPCGWLWNSSRGLCSTAFAIVLCGVLLFVALGAYVVLIYIAVNTKKPKYIAFVCCLGGLVLLIAGNVLASGKPGGEGDPNGRERTQTEDDEEIRKAYGLR